MINSQTTQTYFKKLIMFFVLFGFISLVSIGGCSNNGGNNDREPTALTENDFASDNSLRGDPEEGVIATLLEHPDSEQDENDTGGIGTDRIPLSYPETVEQTFCWEDTDPDATHFMELLDSQENVTMTVEANGDCVSEIITPGEYVMSFNHDGRIDRSFAIFSEPMSVQESKTDGLIDRLKTLAATLLNGIQNSVTEDARAQSVQDNIWRLMFTNSCVGCNLEGANLMYFELERANLTNANLTRANMRFIELDEATLVGANLMEAILEEADLDEVNAENADFTMADLIFADTDEANLRGANFMRSRLWSADLRGSDFTDANFQMAGLIGADLELANLTDADLRDSSLEFANLEATILSGADLVGARWCNSCRCSPPSIGECTGCAPVEQVCTGPPF